MTHAAISRRAFVQTSIAAGGGLLLGFHVPAAFAARVEPQPWKTPTNGVEINAWLTIDKDGVVTVRVPHTEMGQGALTSVAMLIAEELNVDWSKIQTVFADANRHVTRGPGIQGDEHARIAARAAPASAHHAGRRLGA